MTDPVGLEWGPTICMSNTLPSDADIHPGVTSGWTLVLGLTGNFYCTQFRKQINEQLPTIGLAKKFVQAFL